MWRGEKPAWRAPYGTSLRLSHTWAMLSLSKKPGAWRGRSTRLGPGNQLHLTLLSSHRCPPAAAAESRRPAGHRGRELALSCDDTDPRDPCLWEREGWGGGMVGREAGVGDELPPEAGCICTGTSKQRLSARLVEILYRSDFCKV